MAPGFTVKIVDECRVSPPPNTTPISLPLTFLDIPWLLFSPNQSIFFYNFSSHSTTIIPLLKHSLSLTLQQYSPFSGNISTPLRPSKPQIVYSHGDYVSVTISEVDGDAFSQMSSSCPKDVSKLLSLVPDLESPVSNGMTSVPSLAVQITVFGDIGMSIGLSFQHVVADERTYNIFMKTWAATCKSLQEGKLPLPVFNSPPSFDRNVMIDPNEELETTLLNQWWNKMSRKCQMYDTSDMVQSTFVLSIDDLQRIKTMIIVRCKKMNQPQPTLLSAYVLACSLVWVCLMKCQGSTRANFSEKPAYFGFIAGGITRLDFTVPSTYFGNCVAFGRAGAMESDLVSENGIVMAAKAIGKKIKDLDQEVLRDTKRWIAEWEEMQASNVNVIVVGSPKVDLYDMDFGLGKPKKIEKISVDRGTAICLTESRNLKGGMEVGISLSRANMRKFTSLFDISKLQFH